MPIIRKTRDYLLFRISKTTDYYIQPCRGEYVASRSNTLSEAFIRSLELSQCSKREFNRKCARLCSPISSLQQEYGVSSAPVTLPAKLTYAEKLKLKKQKSNPPKTNQNEA